VTSEGQAIAVRMPAIFAGVREQLLSGLTLEEVGILRGMLRRVLVKSGGLTDQSRQSTFEQDVKP
jgi:hypothetical protein